MLSFFRKVWFVVCIPRHRRGAYASSRYVEAGCDGRASDGRRPACARTAKSCGPGVPVLTPCATRSRVVAERGQESRSPGRVRISRKPFARGRPGDFGCTCGSAASFFVARGPWASAGARPSLRPLAVEGGNRQRSSGIACREDAAACLSAFNGANRIAASMRSRVDLGSCSTTERTFRELFVVSTSRKIWRGFASQIR